MIEKFFKVTLKSDVVLNSKLATEGNMETLDYIPGSNFLGIVAAQLYPSDEELKESQEKAERAFNIFHSGDVSFGDATISIKNELSYPVPFDYMMVKGEDKLGEHQVYLQHLLRSDKSNHPQDSEGYRLQLKQKRGGFITTSGKTISKIKKTFALKSAQDATTRRSKEGAMFGFESLKAGQEFVFSVQSEDESLLNKVTKYLEGDKRIGKSKNAEYGQVKIEVLKGNPKRIATFENKEYSLVYVQSNLCVIDSLTGQPVLQPSARDLGLNGEIDWGKSLIRSYSYSPWNGRRNTNDTLRTCIAAGSVLYIQGQNETGNKSIGAFQSEGLGRIIINPEFLKGNEVDAKCDFVKIIEKPKNASKEGEKIDYNSLNVSTSLGNFLKQKGIGQQNELELSQAIQEAYLNATTKESYQRVTSSQWGAIRAYATKADSFEELRSNLLEGSEAYLKHGVAYDGIWSKGKNLENIKNVFEVAKKTSRPTVFIAKFAAQMAKCEQKKGKSKTE